LPSEALTAESPLGISIVGTRSRSSATRLLAYGQGFTRRRAEPRAKEAARRLHQGPLRRQKSILPTNVYAMNDKVEAENATGTRGRVWRPLAESQKSAPVYGFGSVTVLGGAVPGDCGP
jgi:hypothetical protein